MASKEINWRRLKFALLGFAFWLGVAGLGWLIFGAGIDASDWVMAVVSGGMMALAFGGKRRRAQIGDGSFYSEEVIDPKDPNSVSHVPGTPQTEGDRQLPQAHGRL
jgi:hypothetical protein